MKARRVSTAPVWLDRAPVRAELYGLERLGEHARSLALAQQIDPGAPRSRQLLTRLDENAVALLQTYRETAQALRMWSALQAG